MRKKKKKDKNRTNTGEVIRVKLPNTGEILGQVIQLLGGGLLLTRCVDDKVRQVRIPGKFRKRMWTRTGDVIILMPEYGLHPDEKGTLVHRYRKNETNILYKQGLIPEEYLSI